MEAPKTLQEAIQYFADYENCRRFMISIRWEDGNVRCPYCGSMKVSYLEKARVYRCYGDHAKQKFSLKVGTVMEDSAIGLDKWFPAMWMLANCKNGVSSYEIHRALGITQKSAWFLLQRIRLAMKNQSILKLGFDGGPVEMDETFIGGKVSNMHKSKRAKLGGKRRGVTGKAIVVGMLERNGRVKAEIVVERTQAALRLVANKHVHSDAKLVTDEWGGYDGINFERAVVNHAIEYVNGQIHTNGIENFWSLLKRSLGGTYISVEPFHLERYIDEQSYRFNNRATKDNPVNDLDRFAGVVAQLTGKRLTYSELTGKVGETAV